MLWRAGWRHGGHPHLSVLITSRCGWLHGMAWHGMAWHDAWRTGEPTFLLGYPPFKLTAKRHPGKSYHQRAGFFSWIFQTSSLREGIVDLFERKIIASSRGCFLATVKSRKNYLPGNSLWPFGMGKWPFSMVKWPPTRGWKGHFESPGM